MKKYIGTKLIEAEPMTEINFLIEKTGKVPIGYKDREGFKVAYPDGYVSWSPKDAFEEAYRPTYEMTFGLAIEALKKGFKVARKDWNGKRMWLKLVLNGYFDIGCSIVEEDCQGLCPWVGLRTADGKFIPWNAS